MARTQTRTTGKPHRSHAARSKRSWVWLAPQGQRADDNQERPLYVEATYPSFTYCEQKAHAQRAVCIG